MDNPNFPAEYRLSWLNLRLGLYLTIGAFMSAATLMWTERFQQRLGYPPSDAVPYVAAVVASLSLLGFAPFYWKLRVDRSGISRRRLRGWDDWTWSDITDSKLGYYDRTLVDPSRPWWRRTFSLGSLSAGDREQVWQWIAEARPASEVSPLPESIEFKYALGSEVRLDHDGVEFGKKRYCWSEVEQLHIERLRHDRNDFRNLRLKLADRTLRLRITCDHGIVSRNWQGVDEDVLARYLIEKVPANRQVICAILEPPVTVAEASLRLDKLQKHRKELRLVQWLFFGLLVVGVLAAAYEGSIRNSAEILVRVTFLELILMYLIRRDKQNCRIAKLWLDDLTDTQPPHAQ